MHHPCTRGHPMHSTSPLAHAGDREGHGMSDTRFWEHGATPAEGTGEGDQEHPSIVINGQKFVYREGTAATVTLHDDDSKDIGEFHVPYDPEAQPREEELFTVASCLHRDLEHMRSVGQRPLRLAMDTLGALDPKDLGQPWPLQIRGQVGRGPVSYTHLTLPTKRIV